MNVKATHPASICAITRIVHIHIMAKDVSVKQISKLWMYSISKLFYQRMNGKCNLGQHNTHQTQTGAQHD